MAHQQKQQENQDAKWQKVGGWFETYSKMPKGAAKTAFGKEFIPNGINALGMSDNFNPTSLKMLMGDDKLGAYVINEVREGRMSQSDVDRGARDPEFLATLMKDASQYGSYENFRTTFEANIAEIDDAAKYASDKAGQKERALIAANSQERSAGMAASKEDWKREDALRNELTSNPISKSTYVINEAYAKINNVVRKKDGTLAKPSAAGDMSLVLWLHEDA